MSIHIKQTIISIFEKVCAVLLVLAIMLSLGSLLFERLFFPASLAVHFQLQYWILAFICFFVLLARKKFRLAFVGFVYVATLYGIWIHDITLTAHRPASVDLLFLNSQYDNKDILSIADLVRQTNPSMVALVESSPELVHEISLMKGEPVVNHRSYASSCTLFSELSVIGQEVHGKDHLPICIVRYETFDLIAVHPHRPTSPEVLHENSVYFDVIAEMIRQYKASGRHFLIVGDFNATRYSALFRERFEKYDQSILYTWMVWTPWMLPIDHVLTDMQVRVGRSGNIGSDHTALLIDIL